MTAPARWPRLESTRDAVLREQLEALDVPCPQPRCRARPGERCLNVQTGLPLRAGMLSHPVRVTAGQQATAAAPGGAR